MHIAGLREHFKVRFTEWSVGVGLLVWGLIVLKNDALFATYQTYYALQNLSPQWLWGTAAISIAAVRLTFLFINGSFRKSAHLRAIGSGLSACFWGAIWISYLQVDLLPNLGSIGILLALDLYSLWFAAEDAKLTDMSHDPAKVKKAT